jgi:hypothetical protein
LLDGFIRALGFELAVMFLVLVHEVGFAEGRMFITIVKNNRYRSAFLHVDDIIHFGVGCVFAI